MPEARAQHVEPFVHESLDALALHFSIGEVQSRMCLQDPHALALGYTRTMMAFLAFKPAPAHITMIGLGGGSLAKFCWRHLPRTRIDVVEINPHVIALRDSFQVPRDDARFQVLQADGAAHVRHADSCGDVLMVDGFDYDGQPSQLCSQRFYDDCHDVLPPGGLLVVNLHSEHARHDIFVDRIRRSFHHAVLLVDCEEPANTIAMAVKGTGFGAARTLRLPRGLKPAALRQLQPSLALVDAALARHCLAQAAALP